MCLSTIAQKRKEILVLQFIFSQLLTPKQLCSTLRMSFPQSDLLLHLCLHVAYLETLSAGTPVVITDWVRYLRDPTVISLLIFGRGRYVLRTVTVDGVDRALDLPIQSWLQRALDLYSQCLTPRQDGRTPGEIGPGVLDALRPTPLGLIYSGYQFLVDSDINI